MNFSYQNANVGQVNVFAKEKEIEGTSVKALDVTAMGEKGKVVATLSLPIESSKEHIQNCINKAI